MPVTSASEASHSTGLLTDRYELTMVEAALRSGAADRRCVFEVFARRLPDGRRYGVVAGTGRLLQAIADFRFADAELTALESVVDAPTLRWLAGYLIIEVNRQPVRNLEEFQRVTANLHNGAALVLRVISATPSGNSVNESRLVALRVGEEK